MVRVYTLAERETVATAALATSASRAAAAHGVPLSTVKRWAAAKSTGRPLPLSPKDKSSQNQTPTQTLTQDDISTAIQPSTQTSTQTQVQTQIKTKRTQPQNQKKTHRQTKSRKRPSPFSPRSLRHILRVARLPTVGCYKELAAALRLGGMRITLPTLRRGLRLVEFEWGKKACSKGGLLVDVRGRRG